MKIENLILKHPYKYKELCEVLGIQPTSKANNSRIAQFKELERYCEFYKEGHKIIITSIKNTVGVKMDKRKLVKETDKRRLGTNNAQAKCIRYLLCNLLNNYNLGQDEVVGFSKGLLLRKLNLINENYVNAKCLNEKYALSLGVSAIAVDECIDYIDNRSINAVKRAIQVLINQKVIAYKYSYTWVDKKGKHNHATVFEHNAIMEAEFEVMEKMNIRNKGVIFEFGRWEEFKRKVKTYLLEEYKNLFPRLDFYYSSFHFHYNIEQLQKHIKYMEVKQAMSLEEAKNEVTGLFSTSLDKTIHNNHIKVKDSEIDNISDEKVIYRKSENYIPEQTLIKNSIVHQDYKKILISEQLKFDIDNVEIPF
ncbi:hypothetical protein [Paraclostridium sordellii]|uniref:hypothetical protein n=1 Tax=Paraclostridium sordellii TaxID=1505 RepID=UPI000E4B24BE|nr:hypothetical protein [Paeniclostridium sordellii]RGX09338.1 hypothetical protein DWV40_07520 [Paeniclostridium sordellii]